MKDKNFLIFIHQRLKYTYKVDAGTDYMIKLRNIIDSTDEEKETINVANFKDFDV